MRAWVSSSAQEGQATVELAVMVPVALVVALIVVNLGVFVERCARFDRVAMDMALAHGSAPAGTQDTLSATDQIKGAIVEAMDAPDVDISVSVERLDPAEMGVVAFSPGRVRVRCAMEWRPFKTLVAVAGVPMGAPVSLKHERTVVMDMGTVGGG